MKRLGRHIILEFWGCQELEPAQVEEALREAVEACQVSIIDLKVYRYNPQGVTGVAVLAESHMTVHTWPEYGYAALDIFTCGQGRDPAVAIPALVRHFGAERVQIMEVARGVALD